MSRFPSGGHLISWAGLCPRQDDSAGKRRSTRLEKGAPWLKTALVRAAWVAVRKKHSYLQAQFQFQRLRARRGPGKAICAVAASASGPAGRHRLEAAWRHRSGRLMAEEKTLDELYAFH